MLHEADGCSDKRMRMMRSDWHTTGNTTPWQTPVRRHLHSRPLALEWHKTAEWRLEKDPTRQQSFIWRKDGTRRRRFTVRLTQPIMNIDFDILKSQTDGQTDKQTYIRTVYGGRTVQYRGHDVKLICSGLPFYTVDCLNMFTSYFSLYFCVASVTRAVLYWCTLAVSLINQSVVNTRSRRFLLRATARAKRLYIY